MKEIPTHLAIIMDGNGRWAQERGMSRSEGHLAGFKNLQTIVPYIFNKGVQFLSIYAFSTENFKRSKSEVDFLMNLFAHKFNKMLSICKKENIKIVWSGRETSPLPKKVIQMMQESSIATQNNSKGTINICLNYGGKTEIIDAVKKIIDSKLDINELNEETFEQYLYQELPPIDFLIRTSGEYRISNFMLWQLAYAEFYFPSTYFPDFNEIAINQALEMYQNRDRRFGGIKNEN